MSELHVLRGRVVTPLQVVPDGAVVLRGDRIAYAGSADRAPDELRPAVEEAPTGPGYVLPGLVDVHCHGGGGASFPNATTREEALTAVREHRRHGTTTMLASLVTASPDALRARTRTLVGLCEDGELAGIHYEGPFVSEARCGAQDPAYIQDPDPALVRELAGLAHGFAATMTLAPEKPGAYGPGSATEALVESGVVPSFGHTDAGPADAREALASASRAIDGARQWRRGPRPTITHLFNGMRPLHHRDPGPIAEFLSGAARGCAVVELISDGVHVDPSVVRDVYEILGREHVVLITDAMAAAGMPDGSYRLGSQDVTVRAGVARLSRGGSIAGGTAHLLDCVRVAVERARIPLVDAVYMASVQGARIVGDRAVGALRAGLCADAIVTDDRLAPVQVWRRGALVR